MHDPSAEETGNDDQALRQELSLVAASLRPGSCIHFGTAAEGIATLERLRGASAEAPAVFQRACYEAWLGTGGPLIQLGYRLIDLAEMYPDFNSAAEVFRGECREIGNAANEFWGLDSMMQLHDATIAALGWAPGRGSRYYGTATAGDPQFVPMGSHVPGVLDDTWDGVGEWQKCRGWRFIPGSAAGCGHYQFATPANWPNGFVPLQCECREAAIHAQLLRATTTTTDQASQTALRDLRFSQNPFVVAASAWAVGERRMKEAAPHLVRLLEHSSRVVRVYAAEALWKINGTPEGILPVLLDVLAFKATLEENRKAKFRAARLIEQMKPIDQSSLDAVQNFRTQWKSDLKARPLGWHEEMEAF